MSSPSPRSQGHNSGPRETNTPGTRGYRFEALDSLRGICAILVALFHLKAASVLVTNEFIRNAWIFVDFFFVLSGFVICASYRDRLASGYPVRDFMWLRLGRVYPLHFAVLAIFLTFEIFKPGISPWGMAVVRQFSGPRSIEGFFQSLALLQIFGLKSEVVWNGPSWSIAAEIWTYLIAALMIRFCGKALYPVMSLLVIACFTWLSTDGGPYLERTYSLGLVRCLYGFGVGFIAFRIFERRISGVAVPLALAGIIEFVLLVLTGVWVSLAGSGFASMFAPIVFAVSVLVFALEQGFISKMLRTRPLLFVGTISYSIYMVHVFVLSRFIDISILIARFTGWPVASAWAGSTSLSKGLGESGHPVVSSVLVLLAIGSTIGIASLTYFLIERPARDWSRKRLRDRQGSVPPKAPVAF